MLLPDVASLTNLIEVVRIAAPTTVHAAGAVVGEDLAIWDEEHSRQVLNLIAEVPAGELHRCFAPAYGIRAHSAAALLFDIAFCFRCHGALLLGSGVPSGLRGIQGFDADSPAAHALLDRFRACESG